MAASTVRTETNSPCSSCRVIRAASQHYTSGSLDNGIGVKARLVVPCVVATPRDRLAIAAVCA